MYLRFILSTSTLKSAYLGLAQPILQTTPHTISIALLALTDLSFPKLPSRRSISNSCNIKPISTLQVAVHQAMRSILVLQPTGLELILRHLPLLTTIATYRILVHP